MNLLVYLGMIKDKVTIVKTLKTHIQDLEEAFYNNQLLETGREDKRLGFRPREHLTLVIMCALQNSLDSGAKFRISSDPLGYDGILTDLDQKRPRNFGIEQTFVSSTEALELNQAIIQRIQEKEDKGKSYGEKRNLIVLINKKGEIDPQYLIEKSEVCNNFVSYWIIYKEPVKEPQYIVVNIKSKVEEERMYRVKINPQLGTYEAEYLGLFTE